MSIERALILAFACFCAPLTSGCLDDTDENGVEVDRAEESGFARVTFTVVRPNADPEVLPTQHRLYLDNDATVPGRGGPAYAHVPEDRGQLGYRIEATRGAATLEVVDLARLTPEGNPTPLFSIACRSDVVGAGIETAFASPNRGDDGSFVRIDVVDFRHALCGPKTP